MKLFAWTEKSHFTRNSTLKKSVLPLFSLNSNKIDCLFLPIPSLTLQVKQSIARIGKQGFVVSEPKTAKSRRSIHLTTLAIDALKSHRIRQCELRLAAGATWDDQKWIFCNSVGRPIEAGNLLRRSFWPLLEKAGLARMPFHSLRHSTASLLLSIGVHPKIVQELLGHSNISMTLDTYSHVIPALHAEAATQLNTLLTKQKTPVAVSVAVNQG